LVDKIKELCILPSKDKQNIIEQNHRFLVDNFSIEKMVHSYEIFLNDMVVERGNEYEDNFI